MDSNSKFLKYINFFIIHIIAFYLLFQDNLEIIGFGLAIAINVFTNSFLLLDIVSSPKKNDTVVFILIISIISIFISSLMILILLVNLHSKYSLNQVPIQLTNENRDLLDNYKKMYIMNILLVFLISIIYFTLYRIDGNSKFETFYLPFYNFNIGSQYFFADSIFLIIKLLISAACIILSAYMIYTSLILSRINTNNIYIPSTINTQDNRAPTIFPYKKNNNTSNIFKNMFSNINIDYLINFY